jgi:2-polyprenyl-3-methyl-5-hydroxy-6-metoxy-1,4-benzoquinol methylase
MKTFSMRPGTEEKRVPVSCPVCLSSSHRPYWDCGEYGFVKCEQCGHVFQNPQPHFDDLKQRYDTEYFHYEVENQHQFFDLMLKGLGDIRFFQRASALKDQGAFLDVGCATGILIGALKGYGWRVQGVEICEPAARYGIEQRGVPIEVGTLDDAGFSDSTFSVVHFSHVIEHVPDPRSFLEEIYRILIPGGLCVIVTPDVGGAQARFFGHNWRSAIADHLHLFSARTLRRLVGEAGFESLRKRSWGGLGVGTAPLWLKRPADHVAKLLNLGDVMIMLCRKPDS